MPIRLFVAALMLMVSVMMLVSIAPAQSRDDAPAGQNADEPITYASLLREMVNREALARYPDPFYRQGQASSYDRRVRVNRADQWFANHDNGNFIRTETNQGRTEHVMMSHAGPGAITRLWSANPRGTLRVYLDGSDKPVIEAAMEKLTNGEGMVGEPLSAVRGKGHNLYLPIPYAEGCKVTIEFEKEGPDLYYILNYRDYQRGAKVESFSMDTFEKHQDLLKRIQQTLKSPPVVEARQTKDRQVTLGPDESTQITFSGGPGAMRSLTVSVKPQGGSDRGNANNSEDGNGESKRDQNNSEAADGGDDGSETPAQTRVLRRTVLTLRADGEQHAWAPVSYFFGSGAGLNPYEGWWRTVRKDGSMTGRWVMPYQNKFTAKLHNYGEAPVQVTMQAKAAPWQWDERSMYFHTAWREKTDIPTRPRKDFNFITINGKGVVVGDTLTVVNPVLKWWGEGDEKIYFDGESFPSHFGTGTEDYYGYAWGTAAFFEAPFHAQPRAEGPQRFGHITNTRSRSLDAMPFQNSMRFDMEIWHWKSVKVDYTATTHWYGRPGAASNREPTPEQVVKPLRQPETSFFKAEDAIEAESAKQVAGSSNLRRGNQRMGNFQGKWSGKTQLFARPIYQGASVTLRLPVEAGRKQQIRMAATRAPDYGVIQVYVNGNKLGEPIDLYQSKVKPTGPITLGTVTPESDHMKLKIEVVGNNDKAEKTGTYFGIDYFKVEPADGSN